MKLEILDKSLCLFYKRKAIMIRPCQKIDGKFCYEGKPLPWFRVSEFVVGTAIVKVFVLPYILFGYWRLME